MEEFRQLAFEGVANELQNSTDHEKRQGDRPEAPREDRADSQRDRDHYGRDPDRVAEPVDRMLMAGRVLGDPVSIS